MICAKPNRLLPYCFRCRNNPDNLDQHDALDECRLPEIEPATGDCKDFAEMTDE